MRFRPRYSLLTLLVVTALVAGGVMFYFVPHHVIERDSPNWEKEFTYTRDWRWNQIIHGPVVQRKFEGKTPVFFYINYTRHGQPVNWMFTSDRKNTIWAQDVTITMTLIDKNGKPVLPLSEEERLEFSQARDAELQRLREASKNAHAPYEGEFLAIRPF